MSITEHEQLSDDLAEGSDRLDRVLNVTVEFLETHGEHELRIADIVARSGSSVGMIYGVYGNRDGLIRAARVRQYNSQMRRDTGQIADALLACETVTDFAEELVQILARSDDPEQKDARQRRIEMIGGAVKRPDLWAEIMRIQTTVSDMGEQLALVLAERGWLRGEWAPRAIGHLVQMSFFGQLLGDLDADAPTTEQMAAVIRGQVAAFLDLPEGWASAR